MQINTTEFTHILWVSKNVPVHLRLNTATNKPSIQFKLQNNLFIHARKASHCSIAPDFTNQIVWEPKVFIFWYNPYIMQRTDQTRALDDASTER